MAKDKTEKLEPPFPEAYISIQRKDDFSFELIEIRFGVPKVLMTEVFPIVLDKAHDWFIKECKL